MSWSLSVPATPAGEFVAAVGQLELPDYYGEGEEQAALKAAQAEQLAAAKAAVYVLLQSGAVGDPTMGYYGAYLNGHGTPGHGAAQPGWSSETVGVSVFQAAPPPEPVKAATTQESTS